MSVPKALSRSRSVAGVVVRAPAPDGEASELPEKRDAAAKALEEAGYSIRSTDEEENTEAEAHLEGKGKTVDIQVITLCTGKLRIRYTVS